MELHRECENTIYFAWSTVEKLSLLLWEKGTLHPTDYCSTSQFWQKQAQTESCAHSLEHKCTIGAAQRNVHQPTVHININMQLSHNRYESKQKQQQTKTDYLLWQIHTCSLLILKLKNRRENIQISCPFGWLLCTCSWIFSYDEICSLAVTKRLIWPWNEETQGMKNKVLAPPFAEGWKN